MSQESAVRRAALHTLGCKVNLYETDAMRAMLEDAGFQIVPFEETADVYVINTCSVTNIADRKSRQMIRRARRRNPDALICAVGCYVQTASVRGELPEEADLLIGSGKKEELVARIEQCLREREQLSVIGDVLHETACEKLSVPRIEGHTRAYVKVQDGCNMFCSYCIIPYARGRIRSRETEDVAAELEQLAERGVREAVLTGIHLTSFGADRREKNGLTGLIERIARIDGIERIRLGSLEPSVITDETAHLMKETGKVCPHFHLSLQSGCDSVLKRMNRHYTARSYMDRVNLLRSVFDQPAVTTDVIVGFPGETEEEFEATRSFLEEAALYETHLFRYSRREGTKAAEMDGQVPEHIKEERLDILEELNAENKRAFERSWSGKRASLLVEEEAQIDENGCISTPNAGRLKGAVLPSPKDGKRVYTGYTKEYIRAFCVSDKDLRGQVIEGNLAVESLPVLSYTENETDRL